MKYEHWSSLAPLLFELVISAGQKAKEESLNKSADGPDRSKLDLNDLAGEGNNSKSHGDGDAKYSEAFDSFQVKLLLGMLVMKCGLEAVKAVMPEEHMKLPSNISKIKEREEKN